MSERYTCLNCRNRAELNPHGKCSTCGSDAVVSEEATYPRKNVLEIQKAYMNVLLRRIERRFIQ